jgi:hypothetical protein
MLTVRRLLAVGAVATAAAYVGIVVPNAAANGTVAFPGEVIDQGSLTIETTPNSLSVVWYEADGSVKSFSTVTLRKSDKCLINATKVADLSPLLSIRPTSGGVTLPLGYVSNGLGTRENDTCSTANGTFGAGESMELALGTELLSQGIVIDRARLDLEGKFGTSLQYTTFANVADDEGTSGSIDGLWTANDNGSDNGPNDNADVFIGAEGDASDDFQKLSVTPTSADNRGQISLESGGDHGADAASHRTTLWLVQPTAGYEYALDCGDTESEEAGVDDDFAATTFPDIDDLASHPISATLARYDDDLGAVGQPCAPIGANLSSSDLNVLLRKTTVDANGLEQDPTLRFEVVWAVPTSLLGGATDPFQRFVDLDGIDGTNDSNDEFPVEPAQYCSSYTPNPVLDPDGDGVDGFIDVDHAGSVVHPADTRFESGKLSWCVIGDVRTPGTLNVTVDGVVTSIPVIFQRHIWDGQGDPKFF